MDYIIVLKTFQSLTNDETQLSLAQIVNIEENDNKYCKKCGKKHLKDWLYHEVCKKCYRGGDDVCWLLHLEFREQWQQARNGGSTPVTSTPVGNPASLTINSGIYG